MSAAWRLIVDDPLDGALNMAIDRAIQCSHSVGAVAPTLRLYSWKRPTVTLGRFQDAASVDLDLCKRTGIDVVRRCTGGRGVLHFDEITYSIVAGVGDGIPRGVARSYLHLCSGLVNGFGLLGVDASVIRADERPVSNGACYLQKTRADIVAGGGKLSGSAQVWLKDSVMQHGSFVISRDCDLETSVFSLDDAQAGSLRSSVTLQDAMGRRPTLEEIRDAIRCGFEQALGISFRLGHLTVDELKRVGELHRASLVAPLGT